MLGPGTGSKVVGKSRRTIVPRPSELSILTSLLVKPLALVITAVSVPLFLRYPPSS